MTVVLVHGVQSDQQRVEVVGRLLHPDLAQDLQSGEAVQGRLVGSAKTVLLLSTCPAKMRPQTLISYDRYSYDPYVLFFICLLRAPTMGLGLPR